MGPSIGERVWDSRADARGVRLGIPKEVGGPGVTERRVGRTCIGGEVMWGAGPSVSGRRPGSWGWSRSAVTSGVWAAGPTFEDRKAAPGASARPDRPLGESGNGPAVGGTVVGGARVRQSLALQSVRRGPRAAGRPSASLYWRGRGGEQTKGVPAPVPAAASPPQSCLALSFRSSPGSVPFPPFRPSEEPACERVSGSGRPSVRR